MHTTRHLHYIDAPTGLVAIWVRSTTGSDSKDTLYYIHTDHLGSITAVTTNNTSFIKKYSYDAWGRRRNATTWASYTLTDLPIFSRGYTGHEHLDMLGIINMNGRMYDPRLGMFMSADPVVQFPGNPLNYNRYSYVLNNPLKYTDPSGYQSQKDPIATPELINIDWLRHSPYFDYNSPFNSIGSTGGAYSIAGAGLNGNGLDGVYYDWSSNTYRFVDSGTPASRNYVQSIINSNSYYGVYYVNAYAGSGEYMYYKGTSVRFVTNLNTAKGQWGGIGITNDSKSKPLLDNSLRSNLGNGFATTFDLAAILTDLTTVNIKPRSAFDNIALTKSAGKLIAKGNLLLTYTALYVDYKDLQNNKAIATNGDYIKFGVDAGLAAVGTGVLIAATFIPGVNVVTWGIVLFSASTLNTYGAFDRIYEQFN